MHPCSSPLPTRQKALSHYQAAQEALGIAHSPEEKATALLCLHESTLTVLHTLLQEVKDRLNDDQLVVPARAHQPYQRLHQALFSQLEYTLLSALTLEDDTIPQQDILDDVIDHVLSSLRRGVPYTPQDYSLLHQGFQSLAQARQQEEQAQQRQAESQRLLAAHILSSLHDGTVNVSEAEEEVQTTQHACHQSRETRLMAAHGLQSLLQNLPQTVLHSSLMRWSLFEQECCHIPNASFFDALRAAESACSARSPENNLAATEKVRVVLIEMMDEMLEMMKEHQKSQSPFSVKNLCSLLTSVKGLVLDSPVHCSIGRLAVVLCFYEMEHPQEEDVTLPNRRYRGDIAQASDALSVIDRCLTEAQQKVFRRQSLISILSSGRLADEEEESTKEEGQKERSERDMSRLMRWTAGQHLLTLLPSAAPSLMTALTPEQRESTRELVPVISHAILTLQAAQDKIDSVSEPERREWTDHYHAYTRHILCLIRDSLFRLSPHFLLSPGLEWHQKVSDLIEAGLHMAQDFQTSQSVTHRLFPLISVLIKQGVFDPVLCTPLYQEALSSLKEKRLLEQEANAQYLHWQQRFLQMARQEEETLRIEREKAYSHHQRTSSHYLSFLQSLFYERCYKRQHRLLMAIYGGMKHDPSKASIRDEDSPKKEHSYSKPLPLEEEVLPREEESSL